LVQSLDEDGLPPIGLLLQEGDPIYAVLDSVTNTHKVVRHKEVEPAYVDEVRILGPTHTTAAAAHQGIQRVSIKLRFDRRPVVGDKFSSRHGQKGVLSMLWPTEDMPFTDSGMVPDVIINPHAFPSRMTIGMLVESMAGKAGALHGMFQEATPFRFDEQQRAVDYFGEQLRAAGYNYYGTETMYSGVTGEPLAVDIYYGVVYYQRLRHMVKDKAQVRSTGPINNLTRQPVKGRKKGGGIRFGEMERDSLLAHGASFLLHDRLHNSSDRHTALVCKKCGSMLSTHSVPASASTVAITEKGEIHTGSVDVGAAVDSAGAARRVNRSRRVPTCRACGTGEHVVPVPVPYVFRYLANELAGMNIKIKLEMGEGPYA
jgi:DNA-directed RNA polymerase I subunit RPA2